MKKKREGVKRVVCGEQWPPPQTKVGDIPKGLEFISHAKKYGTKALRG
jgi:hypothetical protein